MEIIPGAGTVVQGPNGNLYGTTYTIVHRLLAMEAFPMTA